MAVSTKRSASHAFSIDSLMGKHHTVERDLVSPPKANSVTPPASAAPSLAALNAHLFGMKSLYENNPYLESLALGLNHPAFAGALPTSLPGHISSLPPQIQPLFLAGATHRDLLNPWLLASQQRNLFNGPRFGGDNPHSGLLMQPFRKPKRIRTAFSPAQLLKLEQSFEKNHYVVGQERKDLASNLGLTETQVKVWFQNRRTKHKRTKDGIEDGSEQNYSSEDELEICDDEPQTKRRCVDQSDSE